MIAGVGYLCIGLADLAIIAVLTDSGSLLALAFALLGGASVGIAGVVGVRHDTRLRSSYALRTRGPRDVLIRVAVIAFPLSVVGVAALWWLFHRVSDEAGMAFDLGAVSAGVACGFFLGFGLTYLAASRERSSDERRSDRARRAPGDR